MASISSIIRGDLNVLRNVEARRLDSQMQVALDLSSGAITLDQYCENTQRVTVGSSTNAIKLPNAVAASGWEVQITFDGSSSEVIVNADSGDNVYTITDPNVTIICQALTATPLVPADWRVYCLLTEEYINNKINNFPTKTSVGMATVAPFGGTYSYNGGNSTITTTFTDLTDPALIAILDGTTPSSGDSVLVKNEADSYQNGIYTISVVGGVVVLTRRADAATWAELHADAFAFVSQGATLANTGWLVSSNPTSANWGQAPASSSSNIVWTQFSAAGVILPDNGTYKTGNLLGVRLLGIASDGTGTLDSSRTLDFVSGSLETRLAPGGGLEKFADVTNGGLRIPKFNYAFTATDPLWTNTLDGYWQISIAASVHGMGLTPTVDVYEGTDATAYDYAWPDRVRVTAAGEIQMRVIGTPVDARFAGVITAVARTGAGANG